MPPLETLDRYQTAVYWAAAGTDAYGTVKVAAPVELAVRWQTGRRQTLDANGNLIALDALVVVDRVIAADSIFWLGELSDWYGTGSAETELPELMQAVTYKETPDLKGRHTRYTVGLRFFRGTMAELA